MTNFSNKYIFLYISILVVLVAVLLSLANLKLKPYQNDNKEIEKMQQILYAAGYSDISKEQTQQIFNDNTEEWIIDSSGISISIFSNGAFRIGDTKAFDVDVKSEYSKAWNNDVYSLPLFIVKDMATSDTSFVIPIFGKGLWGPISGYIAIDNDGRTVRGTVFSHKSETPGLGAEITTDHFQSSFIGKMIFDDNDKFVSVQVIKGGVERSKIDPRFGVDAISGATITSKGVNSMLENCLTLYVPFFNLYIK